jgi:predicted dehydrogenase
MQGMRFVKRLGADTIMRQKAKRMAKPQHVNKVRWGVLSTASFGVKVAIPAMQKGEWSEIRAIASRDRSKAERAARTLGIPKAYGSYEELLCDPEIEAIYNPLPNHLHVPWSIKAAEAGKHVLCEKPLSMNVAEARELLAVEQRTGVKIGEAFMVRTNPQWLRARELVRSGRIGKLRSITGFFSYFNNDPGNIRNMADIGGGALMDIGCYPITTSRFIFGEEPTKVVSLIERDPEMRIDRLTSAILDFPSGQAIFTCSIQLVHYQRMHILGTKGRIEIEIPFNAPDDRPCRILIDEGGDKFGKDIKTETLPVCDQYTIQGDLFSKAVRGEGEVPVPVTDGIKNMAVIEALFRSAESGRWEKPQVQ